MWSEDQSVPWICSMNQMYPEVINCKALGKYSSQASGTSDSGEAWVESLRKSFLCFFQHIVTCMQLSLPSALMRTFAAKTHKICARKGQIFCPPHTIWVISLIPPLTLIFPMIDDGSSWEGFVGVDGDNLDASSVPPNVGSHGGREGRRSCSASWPDSTAVRAPGGWVTASHGSLVPASSEQFTSWREAGRQINTGDIKM